MIEVVAITRQLPEWLRKAFCFKLTHVSIAGLSDLVKIDQILFGGKQPPKLILVDLIMAGADAKLVNSYSWQELLASKHRLQSFQIITEIQAKLPASASQPLIGLFTDYFKASWQPLLQSNFVDIFVDQLSGPVVSGSFPEAVNKKWQAKQHCLDPSSADCHQPDKDDVLDDFSQDCL